MTFPRGKNVRNDFVQIDIIIDEELELQKAYRGDILLEHVLIYPPKKQKNWSGWSSERNSVTWLCHLIYWLKYSPLHLNEFSFAAVSI